MTVVEDLGKSDPGGDQARHLLTRLISTPGSSDTERRKGGPSGIEGKIYHIEKPRQRNRPQLVVSFWINPTRQPKKNLKFLLTMFDGGGRLC
jgi:hypothetical protein